jgi:hypothetical protein
LRGALFIHAESNYEIFIQAVKGYKSLGQWEPRDLVLTSRLLMKRRWKVMDF